MEDKKLKIEYIINLTIFINKLIKILSQYYLHDIKINRNE